MLNSFIFFLTLYVTSQTQLNGYTFYKSNSEPKAKGLSFSLYYPSGWENVAESSERVLRKFKKNDAVLYREIRIAIENLPYSSDDNITIENFPFNQILPPNQEIIEENYITINSRTFKYFRIKLEKRFGNMNIFRISNSYYTIINGKMVIFDLGVSGEQKNSNLILKEFNTLIKSFSYVASTFKIE